MNCRKELDVIASSIDTTKESGVTVFSLFFLRAFSSGAFYAKKNTDAISVMDALSTVITAIGAKHAVFRNVFKKACQSKVTGDALVFSSNEKILLQVFAWVEYRN